MAHSKLVSLLWLCRGHAPNDGCDAEPRVWLGGCWRSAGSKNPGGSREGMQLIGRHGKRATPTRIIVNPFAAATGAGVRKLSLDDSGSICGGGSVNDDGGPNDCVDVRAVDLGMMPASTPTTRLCTSGSQRAAGVAQGPASRLSDVSRGERSSSSLRPSDSSVRSGTAARVVVSPFAAASTAAARASRDGRSGNSTGSASASEALLPRTADLGAMAPARHSGTTSAKVSQRTFGRDMLIASQMSQYTASDAASSMPSALTGFTSSSLQSFRRSTHVSTLALSATRTGCDGDSSECTPLRSPTGCASAAAAASSSSSSSDANAACRSPLGKQHAAPQAAVTAPAEQSTAAAAVPACPTIHEQAGTVRATLPGNGTATATRNTVARSEEHFCRMAELLERLPLSPAAPLMHAYEYQRCLGNGVFGAVYRFKVYMAPKPSTVPETAPGFVAAIKVPRGDTREEQELAEALVAEEFEVLQALQGSEHVPRLVQPTHADSSPLVWPHGVEPAPQTPMLARPLIIELADGDLQGLAKGCVLRLLCSERVLGRGPPPAHRLPDAKRWRAISRQMCAAVAHVHACGYVHRDIKPDNFLHAGAHDRIMLADFGMAIATPEDGVIERPGPIGTSNYIAPEVELPHWRQGSRTLYDARAADMWSLGQALLLLWTGRFYYHGLRKFSPRCRGGLRMGGALAPNRGLGHGLPRDLQQLLEGLLVVRPERRLSAEAALQHPYFSGLS